VISTKPGRWTGFTNDPAEFPWRDGGWCFWLRLPRRNVLYITDLGFEWGYCTKAGGTS